MVYALPEDELVFPDPTLADSDGLLAVGGDLSRQRLLLAYRNGIFPWFSEDDPICWYSPPERCVLFPERVKVSKSMAKILRDGVFKLRVNANFKEVIQRCASVPRKDQDGTWITSAMQQAYIDLHETGFAHSVEVYQAETLVGGLYGLLINGVFCGESMFSTVSNASKAALIGLCQQGNCRLVDCQIPNPHLMSLGAEMISREDYLHLLKQSANSAVR